MGRRAGAHRGVAHGKAAAAVFRAFYTTEEARRGPVVPEKGFGEPADVLRWRRERDITVAGGCDSCFPRFEDAPLLPALYSSLKAAGFATPSPIQGQAWPLPVWK